jgi:nucleoside-diphosphate-sugar epimerase
MVPYLRERGWRVRCLVHRRTVETADETVVGDLLDPGAVERAAVGAQAIMHLAAVTHARSARRYEAVNVAGTRRLVEAALAEGVERFVYVSSRAISPQGGAYSRSKRRAEELVASFPGHVIVRLAEVYGTGGNEGIERMLRLAWQGAPIPVVGDGSDVLCPVFVDDAVAAMTAALESELATQKTYTLAGECLTAAEFASACAEAAASPARLRTIPVPLVRALTALSRALPLPLYPDQLARLRSPKPAASPEARTDLGFAPRPLAAGLAALRGETGARTTSVD